MLVLPWVCSLTISQNFAADSPHGPCGPTATLILYSALYGAALPKDAPITIRPPTNENITSFLIIAPYLLSNLGFYVHLFTTSVTKSLPKPPPFRKLSLTDPQDTSIVAFLVVL